MRETGPVRFVLGDNHEQRAAALAYIPLARTLLGQLKNLMHLGGVPTLSRTATLPDGTVIRCASVMGQDTVSIAVPPPPPAPTPHPTPTPTPTPARKRKIRTSRLVPESESEGWIQLPDGPLKFGHEAAYNPSTRTLYVWGGYDRELPTIEQEDQIDPTFTYDTSWQGNWYAGIYATLTDNFTFPDPPLVESGPWATLSDYWSNEGRDPADIFSYSPNSPGAFGVTSGMVATGLVSFELIQATVALIAEAGGGNNYVFRFFRDSRPTLTAQGTDEAVGGSARYAYPVSDAPETPPSLPSVGQPVAFTNAYGFDANFMRDNYGGFWRSASNSRIGDFRSNEAEQDLLYLDEDPDGWRDHADAWRRDVTTFSYSSGSAMDTSQVDLLLSNALWTFNLGTSTWIQHADISYNDWQAIVATCVALEAGPQDQLYSNSRQRHEDVAHSGARASVQVQWNEGDYSTVVSTFNQLQFGGSTAEWPWSSGNRPEESQVGTCWLYQFRWVPEHEEITEIEIDE